MELLIALVIGAVPAYLIGRGAGYRSAVRDLVDDRERGVDSPLPFPKE